MKIKVQNILSVSALILGMFLAAPMTSMAQAEVKQVPSDQKTKVLGLINSRKADSFTMTTLDGSSRYVVLINDATSVKSNTKGVFRGGTDYGATYLLRGLRVEVEGTGNSTGELVAKSVRFNETDLRTAQSLESRIDPVEQQANANTENAKRMAGQIEENTALANRAQGTADEALASATRANTRINGLDEFDPIKTIVVPFATGRFALGPQGRATIDEAAVYTDNPSGVVQNCNMRRGCVNNSLQKLGLEPAIKRRLRLIRKYLVIRQAGARRSGKDAILYITVVKQCILLVF